MQAMIQHHVITPLGRLQNFGPLTELLRPHNITWHVITDNGTTKLETSESWIRCYNFTNTEVAFWARCNNAINWFLDHHSLDPGARYTILNDDDSVEPGYFDKLREISGDVVITSMKRGDSTPADAIPERAHGTNTLVAAPENMKVGFVGVEQISVAGRILTRCRLPIHICGDGQMVSYIVATNPTVYAPDVFVHFNFLEPGRWK